MYMTKAASPYNVRFAFIQMKSTSASALAWGGMTKAHWDGTYYWQFWSNGTDFVGKSSNDGVDWTRNPIKVLSGWTRVVAVACSGTVVHMVYGDYSSSAALNPTLTVHMHYRRGTITSATAITLDAERTLQTWTCVFTNTGNADASNILDIRYYDITIGTDNLLTVIWARNGKAHSFHVEDTNYDAERYVLNVCKSTAADGSTWGSVTACETENENWANDASVTDTESGAHTKFSVDCRPRLAPFASGVIVDFCNKDGVGRYHKSSGWTSFTTFDATIKDVNGWGSVAGGNGGGKVGLVYMDSDDDLEVVWYDGSTLTQDNNVVVGTLTSPTIVAVNSTNGAWFLFFIDSTAIKYRKCTSYDGTWDGADSTFANSLTSPVDLSSARVLFGSVIVLSYQTGSSSPYIVNFGMLTLTLNVAPNAPTLTSPAAGAKRNPSVSVTFTWTFSDPDAGDSQSAFDDDPAFGSPAIDSGKVVSAVSQSSQTMPVTLSVYYWRVKTWDSGDAEGPYSGGRELEVNRLDFSALAVSALDGTYLAKLNVTVKWGLDGSAASGVSCFIYNATAQRASATSSAAGLVQFTVSGSLGGSGSLTLNGTKDSVTGSGSLVFSVGVSGISYSSCPSIWQMSQSQALTVQFTNAASINSTSIKLKNVRLVFKLMSGSSVLFQTNSSVFDANAGSVRSFTQSLTPTGIAVTGSYVLRCLMYQLGSEWLLGSVDQTVQVNALGNDAGPSFVAPKLVVPSVAPVSLPQGSSKSLTCTVQLSQASTASFAVSVPVGVPSGWVTVSGPSSISMLGPAQVQISLSVPRDASPGVYTVTVPVSASASGGTAHESVQFTLTVDAYKPPEISNIQLPSFGWVSSYVQGNLFPILVVVALICAVVAAALAVLHQPKTKHGKYYH